MKIKAAIIGCGVWGRNHARVYRDIKNVELSAVVDTSISTAREVGEKYNTPWYTDPEKVLNDPEIQLVNICTPTATHTDIALQAIESGKHVLVEKPMTNTTAEARRIIKNAEKKGVKLTVGFVERFNPAVQEAIKRVNNYEIGEVILAHTRRVSRSPGRIGDVGVVKDLAIHDIDIVNHLFKDPPKTVYSILGKIQHPFEDYANISITYPRNRNAFIETNWMTPRKIRTLILTGTEGIINVEYITQELTIENNSQLIQPHLQVTEPLRLELESFTNAIINDQTPEVTGEDGLKALQICEAALKSAEAGREIRIS